MAEKFFEPGTIANTRKNIGDINKEEAQKMMKILGGEIIKEKPAPVEPIKPQRSESIHRSNSNGVKAKSPTEAAILASTTNTSTGISSQNASEKINISEPANYRAKALSSISAQDWMLVDKLMISDEYRIKTDYGIFNFVRLLQKNGLQRIDKNFAQFTLSNHIEHLESFITLVKTIIQLSPTAYQSRIKKETELKFRFLKKISEWNTHNLRTSYLGIKQNASRVQIQDLFPYIKAIYALVIQILYLGDKGATLVLKEVFNDVITYPDTKRSAISNAIKDCAREWAYIYYQIAKGLYPLLFCACGGIFLDFNMFFKQRASDILKFTGKSKFDILVKTINVSESIQSIDLPNEELEQLPENSEEQKKQSLEKEKNEKIKKAKEELIKTGLKILETLFPGAGFSDMNSFPDYYPYFQPLYDFPDGFNLLSKDNPLQATVILLRIIEDLFQGCRNINFIYNSDTSQNEKNWDSISDVFNDWTFYREVLFDKTYCKVLKDLVSEQYTKRDFINSSYGKTMQTNLWWFIKYYFLPFYNFDKLVLKRPEQNNTLKPLNERIKFICSFFMEITHKLEVAKNSKIETSEIIMGIKNPWAHYKFDLPNIVSERLDILLGAKRKEGNITANNANLIKYTLCICAVLNWWINDPNSPAYSTNPFHFYRISNDDGGPLFSVPLRNDQKKLFNENLKKISNLQKQKDNENK